MVAVLDLPHDVAEDDFLTHRIFSGVGMVAIHHDLLAQTCFFQALFGFPDGDGVKVRAVLATAQDEVAVAVPPRLDHGGQAVLVDAEKMVWRQRGLHVEENAHRAQAYIETFRIELHAVTHAAGYKHPGQFTPHDVEVSAGPGIFKSLYEIYGYNKKQYAPDMEPVFKEAEYFGRPPLTTTESPIPPDSASSSAG